jgi:inner membrane protein
MVLEDISFWYWLIAGGFFIILEVLLTAGFFLWMGVAAVIVAGILMMFPELGWEVQLVIFSALSIASVLIWKARLKKYPTPTEDGTLNNRAQQYVGRSFSLSDPIVNGLGRIHVDDSFWAVAGDDCELGTKVRVVSAQGVTLNVVKDELKS